MNPKFPHRIVCLGEGDLSNSCVEATDAPPAGALALESGVCTSLFDLGDPSELPVDAIAEDALDVVESTKAGQGLHKDAKGENGVGTPPSRHATR